MGGSLSNISFDQGRRTASNPRARISWAIVARGSLSRPATTWSSSSAPYQFTAASLKRLPFASTIHRPLTRSGRAGSGAPPPVSFAASAVVSGAFDGGASAGPSVHALESPARASTATSAPVPASETLVADCPVPHDTAISRATPAPHTGTDRIRYKVARA